MEKKFRNFIIIWMGQFCSILGSGLSAFGLSVWLYYKTGAATPFALSFLCNLLPGILFAPIAGSYADRKNRKKIMMLADSMDACIKIVMVGLLFTGAMRVWMVYPILFLSSTFSTFQSPAYSASIPMLVEENHLSRANGLIQLSGAAQNMISPALAGALFPIIGLKGLIIVDFGTYIIGVLSVVAIKIPQAKVDANNKGGAWLIVRDLANTIGLIRRKNGFLQVILVFSFLNFVANIVMVLVGPMILANYTSVEYGNVESIYAFSMLIGSVIATALPRIKNLYAGMFAILAFSGMGLVVAGASPRWITVGIGMSIFFLGVPYANTLFQTGMQTSFGSDSLGRIGALISALLKIASPFACIFSGPIIDYVFEPFMSSEGTFGYEVLGRYIGTGAGRGSGLMFVICGCVLSFVCIIMAIRYSKDVCAQDDDESLKMVKSS